MPRLAPRWLLYKVGHHCKHLGLCRIDCQIAKSAFTRVVSFCHHGLLSAELDRDTHELAVLHACVVGCISLLRWKGEFRWIYITILYCNLLCHCFWLSIEATTVKVASQAKHLNWKEVESRWPWDAVSLVITLAQRAMRRMPFDSCIYIYIILCKVSYMKKEFELEDWLAVASRVLAGQWLRWEPGMQASLNLDCLQECVLIGCWELFILIFRSLIIVRDTNDYGPGVRSYGRTARWSKQKRWGVRH